MQRTINIVYEGWFHIFIDSSFLSVMDNLDENLDSLIKKFNDMVIHETVILETEISIILNN